MLENELTRLLGIDYPLIQAPMAGGITTTELVTAVSNNGGLGSIGAGYMSASQLCSQIKEVKAKTAQNFSINIFVPSPYHVRESESIKAHKDLQDIRSLLNMNDEKKLSLPSYEETFATYEAQIEVVIEEKVPVVSFTFGLPSEEIVEKLKAEDIILMATATTVAEAVEIERLGLDVIIAQGSEAGGHRGNFLEKTEQSLIGLMSLVPQIVDRVTLPIVAAGGIMDGRGTVAAIALGASAVQMGTAFLTTEESGAHALHKQAILQADESSTRLTKSFSGKHARGINNQFIRKMDENQSYILPYPAQNSLTQRIRKEAQSQNKDQFMSLWSGQSVQLARDEKVARFMLRIRNEVEELLNNINR